MSVDCFVPTPDGRPAWLAMPGFAPGESHGYPEFIASCSAVVMGRTTFDPALNAPNWALAGKHVYVLSSRPLEAARDGVTLAQGGPGKLLAQLRAERQGHDVCLLGAADARGLPHARRARDARGLDPAGHARRGTPLLASGQLAAAASARAPAQLQRRDGRARLRGDLSRACAGSRCVPTR